MPIPKAVFCSSREAKAEVEVVVVEVEVGSRSIHGRGLSSALLVLVMLSLAACSESSSTDRVPSVEDPANGGGGTLNPGTPTTDSRLPDISRSARVALSDRTNYSGLQDIAGTIYPPLQGEPLLQLTLTGDRRSSDVTGDLLFGFEDYYEYWGARLNAFPGAGYKSSNFIDAIFSDPELTMRVVGTINSSGRVSGSLHYRVRQSGETQCRKQSCQMCYAWGCVPTECPGSIDLVTPCRNYMSEWDPNVKLMGTFQDFEFSKWNQ